MPQSKYVRYNHSEKGIKRRNRYGHSEKYHDCRRQRYHALQEEAGCYGHIEVFLPGLRLIRALKDAEVVQI